MSGRRRSHTRETISATMTISVGFGPVPYCQPRYMSATPATATAPAKASSRCPTIGRKLGMRFNGSARYATPATKSAKPRLAVTWTVP